MLSTSPKRAKRPLVLALDVGTSSSRAAIYDAFGRMVESTESRIAYRMHRTRGGGVEIEADELFNVACRNIDETIGRADSLAKEIRVVAPCTFWHSLVGVDRSAKALTPVYSWNDTRSSSEARQLADKLGIEWIHSRTGCMPHASYYPARLLWLRRAKPELYQKVARWMSFGEYFYLKIFGRALASVSMASGTGLFNPNANDWDAEMLQRVGIERRNLSPLAADDEALTGPKRQYARRWPQLASAAWMPAIGDGAANQIGSGCVTRNRVALMIGTSGAMRVCFEAAQVTVPRGLWCYRANRRYALLGGALSNGGDVFEWCQRALRLEPPKSTARNNKAVAQPDADVLERQLRAMQPDSHGLTVLPFFSGERSTGWADYARAAIVGISLSTEPLDILRAMMESVAYRFAAIYDLLREEISPSSRLIASGGALAHSTVWTQIMADCIGAMVIRSAAQEASERGAALLALHALGHIKKLDEAPAAHGELFEPDARRHERYKSGRTRQQILYEQLVAR